MRTLKRNQQVLYYANPIDTTEIYDGDYRTSEYAVTYGEPIKAKMNISPEQGSFDMAQYGVRSVTTKTLIPETLDLPIDSQTVFWIDISPKENYNYVVTSIAKSLNSLKITVKSVN